MPDVSASSEDQVRRIRMLADLAERLRTLGDVRTLQVEILAQALQFFNCASGGMVLCEAEGPPRMGPAVGRAAELPPRQLLDLAPVRDTVLAGRRPLVVAEPENMLGADLAGWSSVAVVPMSGSDRVLGLILLGERRDGRGFDAADVALMAAMGNMVGGALETNVALAEFRHEMGERMDEAMSELSRASAELARIKSFNEDLFESMPIGVVVFDTEFRVTFRNSAADRLWPEDRSILAAGRRTDLLRRDPTWETALRNVLDMQQAWRAEQVTFERPGRDPVRMNLSCGPLFSGERNVAGGVLVVEDVTLRVQMEHRMAVSERLAGVGRLASMVAHEINNPLDGIIRLVNLSKRVGASEDDPRLEKYLDEAHRGLMRMVGIVRELLEFSRFTTGSVEPMPIRDLLVEASEGVAPQAEARGVTVALDCPEEMPALKSSILYHVVLNLLKNAVEAMPDGGEARVRAECRDDVLCIEVDDEGPGIPEESLPRIFEPYYSRKPGMRGTGLGLVVCRDLVEKQGGAIEATNRAEGGARFTVSIPLAPGAGPRAGDNERGTESG
jgi:signal transduction histidine kinase